MMQCHIRTDKDLVTVHADVTKIEVEDIVETDVKQTLRLHRVKELKPVKKPKLDNWLEPEVYKPKK